MYDIVSVVAQGAKKCVHMLPFVCEQRIDIHRFESAEVSQKDIQVMGGKLDAGR